jgi:hypothetical protein
MRDDKSKAYAIERRYRMLSEPWHEMLLEIRAERGALLGTKQYEEMAGVEKATALNTIDERLVMVQKWLLYYDEERTKGASRSLKKWLKEVSILSDLELEGVL